MDLKKMMNLGSVFDKQVISLLKYIIETYLSHSENRYNLF